MVDELLSLLPPYLKQPDGRRAYLTITTWKSGWQAGYVLSTGFVLKNFSSAGDDPVEALILLKEQIDFLNLLNAPSIVVEGEI